DHGAGYVCLMNNDIEFTTPVIHQLLDLCLRERSVGAVAPTQVCVEPERQVIIYRVHWDCSQALFDHDTTPPTGGPEFLESDYCEFTCVLLPAAVFREIGLLDDNFGFYYEDADFGFRLHEVGYRTVYHQYAQIRHYASTTFNKELAQKKLHF